MKRSEFLNKIISYLLLTLITGLAIFLGRRAAKAADCGTCPGRGICSGRSDCSTYLSE